MVTRASLLNTYRNPVGGYWGPRKETDPYWAQRQGKEAPGRTLCFLVKYLRQLTRRIFSPSKTKIRWVFFHARGNYSEGFSVENQASHCLWIVLSPLAVKSEGERQLIPVPNINSWPPQQTQYHFRFPPHPESLLCVLCCVCPTLPSMQLYPFNWWRTEILSCNPRWHQPDGINLRSHLPDFRGQYLLSQTWEASETGLLFDWFSNGAPQPKIAWLKPHTCGFAFHFLSLIV